MEEVVDEGNLPMKKVTQTKDHEEEEEDRKSSSSISYIDRCFGIESLFKCLGIESNKPHQPKNDSHLIKEDHVNEEDPSSSTDPPSTTEVKAVPPRPSFSHGSGPKIN